MSKTKPLFIPLKAEYYDAFAAGTKTEELRIYGDRWNEKTCAIGRAVTLSKGYGKAHRITNARVFDFRRTNGNLLPPAQRQAVFDCYGKLDVEIAVITIDIGRRLYQKSYHTKNREQATERKRNEDIDRHRARCYWRSKILYNRDQPFWIRNVSAKIVEQERVKYLRQLNQPCQVVKK